MPPCTILMDPGRIPLCSSHPPAHHIMIGTKNFPSAGHHPQSAKPSLSPSSVQIGQSGLGKRIITWDPILYRIVSTRTLFSGRRTQAKFLRLLRLKVINPAQSLIQLLMLRLRVEGAHFPFEALKDWLCPSVTTQPCWRPRTLKGNGSMVYRLAFSPQRTEPGRGVYR